MLTHSIRLLGLLSPIAALIGCDGAVSPTRESRFQADYPPYEILIGGKRLVQRGRAKLRAEASVSATPTQETKEIPVSIDVEERAKLDRLSLEELADRLRLVTLFQGYEYIEAEPDINRAAEMRANEGREVVTPPGAPHVAPLTAIAERPSIQRAILGGTDNRVIAWDNTTVPYNSYLAVRHVGHGCSAVSIGTHTAISAAHCFYQGGWFNFDPNHPTDPSYLAPGANIGQPSPNDFPWGQFTCFGVTVYNAWIDSESTFWDMAVMDFSGCSDSNNPGWVAGYNGSWANMSFSGSKVVTVFGYPGACPSPFIGFPQVCGGGGTAYLYPVPQYPWEYPYPAYLATEEIDTSTGTSGASWTYKNPSNNWYYTIGTHRGAITTWPYGTKNTARRLANEYWSLVQLVSVDF